MGRSPKQAHTRCPRTSYATFGDRNNRSRSRLNCWHPRDIPESLLKGAALQEQQGHTLPPLEQWYLMLLHNGSLPGALVKRPNTALTTKLLSDTREQVPRLRFELTEVGLRNFLLNAERIGVVCTKYRNSAANGWTFPPLSECREGLGAVIRALRWDNDAKDWV
jgi:hypothetical protein